MIWESYYWKKDLLRVARRINTRRFKKGTGDLMMANLEKDIMIGFYTIRKLIEGKKVSDSVAEMSINLISHPSKGKPVTIFNRHNLGKLYYIRRSRNERKEIVFICNQIIHSFVFSIGVDEQDRVESVFFSSDRMRSRKIFHMPLLEIVKLFEIFSMNYPATISCSFENGEMVDIQIDYRKPEPLT